jgi:hypothetical protein
MLQNRGEPNVRHGSRTWAEHTIIFANKIEASKVIYWKSIFKNA